MTTPYITICGLFLVITLQGIRTGPAKRYLLALPNACSAPPHLGASTGLHYKCPAVKHNGGQVCSVYCKPGYSMIGPGGTVTCHNRRWVKSAGIASTTCTTAKCPKVSVSNGIWACKRGQKPIYNYLDYQGGDTCRLTCNKGYTAVNPTFSCTASPTGGGVWSPTPSCKASQCPTQSRVSNGVYQCSTSTHNINSQCILHCNTGFTPSTSSSTITCRSTGTWSTPASCVQITCATPPKVTGGSYRCPSSTHRMNDVCHLQCSSGYKPSTSKTDITCLSSSKWSTAATCLEKKCPPPPTVTHGTYSCAGSSQKLNTVCHLQCSTGYKPSAAKSDITCLLTEKWSPSSTCVEKSCPVPPTVTNGVYKCTSSGSHKVNYVCHLQCSSGYKPSTVKSGITCLSTEKWSSASSCVEKKCPPPPPVTHGTYSCPGSSQKLNTVCYLQCSTGYKPSAAKSDITCLSSEKWSPSSTCVEKKCPPPPTVANGTYSCAGSSQKLNTVCHLQCSTGYKPSAAKSDIACLSTENWSTPASCTEIPPPTTSSVSSSGKALQCEVCPGPLCGLIPGNDPSVTCPQDKPFCSNHLVKDVSGTLTITKGCASEEDCNSKWWHGTSDKIECTNFDPSKTANMDLSCYYCCTEPGCNKNIVPDEKTLFIGYD